MAEPVIYRVVAVMMDSIELPWSSGIRLLPISCTCVWFQYCCCKDTHNAFIPSRPQLADPIAWKQASH